MARDEAATIDEGAPAITAAGQSCIVLVCEHASAFIPAKYHDLGLTAEARRSHAAWDPGALAVTNAMARHLEASTVAARVSRLVYDCNRPPEAPDAMPVRSEVFDIPGNRGLGTADKAARVEAYYRPFHAAVARTLERVAHPVLVTVHSFTPIYGGTPRTVEIGILHDSDTRLADAMLDLAAKHTDARVARNEPYGPNDGVTHTLREHAIGAEYLNVMLEVRNDLIAAPAQQGAMAAMLSGWLVEACALLRVEGEVACRA